MINEQAQASGATMIAACVIASAAGGIFELLEGVGDKLTGCHQVEYSPRL